MRLIAIGATLARLAAGGGLGAFAVARRASGGPRLRAVGAGLAGAGVLLVLRGLLVVARRLAGRTRCAGGRTATIAGFGAAAGSTIVAGAAGGAHFFSPMAQDAGTAFRANRLSVKRRVASCVLAAGGKASIMFRKSRRAERRPSTILIVEDDVLIAFDNEHILREAGFAVAATVDNMADALRLIDG